MPKFSCTSIYRNRVLYTDYNYAQASYGLYTEISGDKWQWGINYFSEGDIKAQPLLLSYLIVTRWY